MSKSTRVAITLLAFLFLSSCFKEAKETVSTNNNEFKVELLFEVDGCRIYRFYDGGYSRYFSNCKGNISWQEVKSKNNKISVDIPTNIVK